MAVSYNGLWKLLIDNNMKKMDLVERVGISSSTLAKMSKGEIVSLIVLEKICDELNCDFGDLISYDRKGGKKMMEYNAASVKFLLWHVETKETAKLLQEHSFDEIRRMVLEDNIYQQKSRERAQSEFSCIKKRLQAYMKN